MAESSVTKNSHPIKRMEVFSIDIMDSRKNGRTSGDVHYNVFQLRPARNPNYMTFQLGLENPLVWESTK